MNGIGIGDFYCRHDARNAEVRLSRGRGSDTHSFVSEAYVQTFAVGSRVDCYRLDTHLAAGTYNAESNFAAVGNEYFFKHRLTRRSTSYGSGNEI